jgi:hypothetical protein
MSEKKYYLTTRWSKGHKAYLATISLGSPQKGDTDVVVCDVELFNTPEEAYAWFERMMISKPWENGSENGSG